MTSIFKVRARHRATVSSLGPSSPARLLPAGTSNATICSSPRPAAFTAHCSLHASSKLPGAGRFTKTPSEQTCCQLMLHGLVQMHVALGRPAGQGSAGQGHGSGPPPQGPRRLISSNPHCLPGDPRPSAGSLAPWRVGLQHMNVGETQTLYLLIPGYKMVKE